MDDQWICLPEKKQTTGVSGQMYWKHFLSNFPYTPMLSMDWDSSQQL
jgi:hypothetical protein